MPIRTRRDPPISWVIIDREERGNSLDYEHSLELAEAVKSECSAGDTAVLALRGAGSRFFSAGVDLGSVASLRGAGEAWRLMAEGIGGVWRALDSCGKPVVAAVNGHAIGVGFEILYACDIAIAVRSAKLGVTAARWGLVPPATPTLGPLVIGAKRAAYLALTGELITAEEALEWGIINGVVESVEELESRVRGIASRIASNDPWAVGLTRRLLASARGRAGIGEGLLALAYSASRPEAWGRARGFIEGRR